MAVSEELIKKINNLIKLDHDAVEAYQQAIDRMKSETCKQKLSEFQEDHRRHVRELSECVTRFGGKPQTRDVKGFFLKGMTAVQSMMGDEMALIAMQTNEKLTNRTYDEATKDASFPDDVKRIISRNRGDEARHLAWINKAIEQRLWEERGTEAQV